MSQSDDTADVATEMATRLGDAAGRAGMSPREFLRDGMSGTSADGSVRVWVDGLGRVQRVRIAPGTMAEGDEERLSAALTEAARAAAGAIADLLTPEALRQPLAEPRSQQKTTRPDDDDDDDDVVPVVTERGHTALNGQPPTSRVPNLSSQYS